MFFSQIVAISSLLVLGSAMPDPNVVLLGGDSDARRRQSVHNNCWRPVWCQTDLFSCGNGIVLKRCGWGCNFPMCPVVDIDECSFDWECPIGMNCRSGSCTSNVNSCSFDWECAAGQRCRNGRCRRRGSNTNMFTCVNGDQIPMSQVCNGEFNCSDGSDEWTSHGCLQFSTGRRLENSEAAAETLDFEPTAETLDVESTVEQPAIQRRTSPAIERNWCSFDWECMPGFECRSGRCEASSSSFCSFDWECPVGMSCRSGFCSSNVNFCSFDWECPIGMNCRSGSCTSNVNSCSFDWECPAGMNCRSGSCTSNVNSCSFDWECPVGMNCRSGSCSSNVNFCSFDWECPVGMNCRSGFCSSNVIFCSFDWECPVGELCGRNGTCRRRGGRPREGRRYWLNDESDGETGSRDARIMKKYDGETGSRNARIYIPTLDGETGSRDARIMKKYDGETGSRNARISIPTLDGETSGRKARLAPGYDIH